MQESRVSAYVIWQVLVKCKRLMSLVINQAPDPQFLHSQHNELGVHKNFMSCSSLEYWKCPQVLQKCAAGVPLIPPMLGIF